MNKFVDAHKNPYCEQQQVVANLKLVFLLALMVFHFLFISSMMMKKHEPTVIG